MSCATLRPRRAVRHLARQPSAAPNRTEPRQTRRQLALPQLAPQLFRRRSDSDQQRQQQAQQLARAVTAQARAACQLTRKQHNSSSSSSSIAKSQAHPTRRISIDDESARNQSATGWVQPLARPHSHSQSLRSQSNTQSAPTLSVTKLANQTNTSGRLQQISLRRQGMASAYKRSCICHTFTETHKTN